MNLFMYARIYVSINLCKHFAYTMQAMSAPSQRRQRTDRRPVQPAVRSLWAVLTISSTGRYSQQWAHCEQFWPSAAPTGTPFIQTIHAACTDTVLSTG